jgi:hypothetical protein
MAVRAHGGKEKLSQLDTLLTGTKATIRLGSDSATVESETWLSYPSRMKRVSRYKLRGEDHTEVIVLNGDRGWVIRDKEKRECNKREIEYLRFGLYTQHILTLHPLLEDPRFTLTPLGKRTINGRWCVGIKVSAKGQKDVRLYFDITTGLLAKVECPGLTAEMKEVLCENFVVRFRTISGARFPLERRTVEGGGRRMDVLYVKVRFLKKIDEAVFAKPY